MDNLILKTKNDLKKIKKNFFINPHLHWIYLLRFFIFISIILILFAFYLFYRIKTDKVFVIDNVEPNKKVILKENLLKNIEDMFLNKENNLTKIKNGEIFFKDPSS